MEGANKRGRLLGICWLATHSRLIGSFVIDNVNKEDGQPQIISQKITSLLHLLLHQTNQFFFLRKKKQHIFALCACGHCISQMSEILHKRLCNQESCEKENTESGGRKIN